MKTDVKTVVKVNPSAEKPASAEPVRKPSQKEKPDEELLLITYTEDEVEKLLNYGGAKELYNIPSLVSYAKATRAKNGAGIAKLLTDELSTRKIREVYVKMSDNFISLVIDGASLSAKDRAEITESERMRKASANASKAKLTETLNQLTIRANEMREALKEIKSESAKLAVAKEVELLEASAKTVQDQIVKLGAVKTEASTVELGFPEMRTNEFFYALLKLVNESANAPAFLKEASAKLIASKFYKLRKIRADKANAIKTNAKPISS